MGFCRRLLVSAQMENNKSGEVLWGLVGVQLSNLSDFEFRPTYVLTSPFQVAAEIIAILVVTTRIVIIT